MKLLGIRIKQCEELKEASPCVRRKVSALIIDPYTNAVVSDGYCGSPRNQTNGDLCGGTICLRAEQNIPSGTQNDIGCHHAEMNAILNAARLGQSTAGKVLIVNCDPCLMCAKAIHHAGIVKVYSPMLVEGAHRAGVEYLISNKIAMERTSL